jgi:hypothetical protein
MTFEDQVFIANVVVIDPTWETVAMSVINRLIGATVKFSAIVKSASIEGFMRGTTLFRWRCTTHLNAIKIISLGSVFVFSMIDG